ncbi:MAG: helix-turn-helix domain-containing protein [Victivallales bacterium]|nr:helix-turn-helix domain-containing protein [Victivallales bacterium]
MKLKPDLKHRAELYAAIDRGELGFPRALQALRRSIGKTQAEYAELAGLSTRIFKEIEQGRGNPTLKSIRKAIKPLALDITVCRIKNPNPYQSGSQKIRNDVS